jgi:hypothetical protein
MFSTIAPSQVFPRFFRITYEHELKAKKLRIRVYRYFPRSLQQLAEKGSIRFDSQLQSLVR